MNNNAGHIAGCETKYTGLLAIITDRMELSRMDAMNIIYRDKDRGVFNNVNNMQACRMLFVPTRQAMVGYVFVVFIASILIAEMRQRLKGMQIPG